jgi:hypothetical protein
VRLIEHTPSTQCPFSQATHCIFVLISTLFSSAAEVLPREIPCYSLLECYTDGQLDSSRWLRLRHREDEDYFDNSDEIFSTNVGDESNDPPSQHERKKRQRRIILARQSESGELEAISPTEPMWYHLYVSCPNIDCSRFQAKFRR